jgi:hypothetical protein
MPPTKSNQDQFLVEIAGLPGTWSRHTSPETTFATRKDYDGGAKTPDVIVSGKAETGDIVCSRNYRADRDGPMIKQLRKSPLRTSAAVTPIDAEGVRIGAAENFRGVVKVVKGPDSDSNGGNQGTDVVVTLEVESVD